jgi:peptide/nickel transport system permease protein
LNYILKRLLQAIPTILIVIVLNFVLVRLAPGNPIAYILSNTAEAPPSLVAKYIHLYGLDQPVYVQLWRYLENLAHGDLGYSFTYNAPISTVLLPRIEATLLLTGVALAIQIGLGVGLGIWALKGGRIKEFFLNMTSIVSWSAPTFWVAMILAIVLGVYLKVFPVGGMYDFGATGWALYSSIAWHLVLPALSLALAGFGLYFRIARAKGCSEGRVLLAHAFKNALLPIVTVIGTNAAFLITGAALVEVVFGWPGIGFQLDLAINARDYEMIEAIFLVVALMVVIANLVADILYTIIDPRVKYK